MNVKPVLNAKGRPFSDPDAAAQKALTLTEELGEEYAVIDYQGGYAVALKRNGSTPAPSSAPAPSTNIKSEADVTTESTMMSPPRTITTRIPKSQIAQEYEERKAAATIAVRQEPQKTPVSVPVEDIQLRPAWRFFWKQHVLAALGFLLALSPRLFMRIVTLFQIDSSTIDSIAHYGVTPLLSFIGLAIAMMSIGYAMIGYYSRRYLLGPNTIESNIGLVARRTVRIEYIHIRSVDVEQGILDRMMDIGRVDLSTANTAGLEVTFEGVKAPMAIQEEIYRRKRLIERRGRTSGQTPYDE